MASRHKQRKKKARERRNRKKRNVARNARSTFKYALEVFVGGEWLPGRGFKDWGGAAAYIQESEESREKGSGVVRSRIRDLQTGQICAMIEGNDVPVDGVVRVPVVPPNDGTLQVRRGHEGRQSAIFVRDL